MRLSRFIPVLLVVALSCTPPESAPDLEIATTSDASPATASDPPSTPADQLKALERATGRDGPLGEDLKDVRAMLVAQDFDAKGDAASATKHWLEALNMAEGAFGKLAFEGWVKAYVKALDKKTDRLVLARLLIAETRSGSISPHMRARGITTADALAPLLSGLVPEALLPDGDVLTDALRAPRPGVPEADPTLADTAKKNCKAKKLDVESWRAFKAGLPPRLGGYWEALLLQCAGRSREALVGFKAAATALSKDTETQGLAVEALARAAVLERALAMKKEAGETYRDLMEVWDAPGVTAASLGLDASGFAIRRVEDTLWAARYRALVGDYENGKIFAQKALELVANAYTTRGISATTRDALAVLRAEAYHVLAFRIAVEKREFESALSLNLLALQSPNLNTEWRERLTFFAGLYDYLGGNFETAKKRWDGLLAETRDDAMKATTYFWLAKSYDHMDRKDESRFYLDALTEDYPLSFYTTVAARVAGLSGKSDWRKVFGDPEKLRRKLAVSDGLSLARERRTPATRRLLTRAETLLAARLTSWLKLAAADLEAALPQEVSSEANLEALVYLSRLHYAAGDHAKSITLTTKLAKAFPGFWKRFPEQLVIHFPTPYLDSYQRAAMDTGLDREMLLAITRQESAFTADAKSGAAAVGLMQLIAPTGERFARELGLAHPNGIEELLRNPEANIRMGSRYLRFLNLHFKGFPPAIYGGYNAGEYAMEGWLGRRGHSDPLMFVEMVPFGETKDYIRNVWRNLMIYRFLEGKDRSSLLGPSDNAGRTGTERFKPEDRPKSR